MRGDHTGAQDSDDAEEDSIQTDTRRKIWQAAQIQDTASAEINGDAAVRTTSPRTPDVRVYMRDVCELCVTCPVWLDCSCAVCCVL